MAYWSDTHTSDGVERKDFKEKDWIRFYLEHGALYDLAVAMAKARMREREKLLWKL